MKKPVPITSVEGALACLARSSDSVKLLKASQYLYQRSLDMLDRPRLKRRFSETVLPVLLREILRYIDGRSKRHDVVEMNLKVIANLSDEASAQGHILLRLYKKLCKMRRSRKVILLQETVERTLEKIYGPAGP